MQRSMNTLQWLELLGGIAAGAVGLLGLGYALFGQLGSYGSSTTSCGENGICATQTTYGTTSLAQTGMSPDAWFNVSILGLCLLAVILSVVLHSLLRQKAWLVVLWFTAGFVLFFALLAILSIGLFIMPAALLALAAAALGTGAQVANAAWG